MKNYFPVIKLVTRALNNDEAISPRFQKILKFAVELFEEKNISTTKNISYIPLAPRYIETEVSY